MMRRGARRGRMPVKTSSGDRAQPSGCTPKRGKAASFSAEDIAGKTCTQSCGTKPISVCIERAAASIGFIKASTVPFAQGE